ncbi:MAG: nitrilase-related carbon-nitrogen hydrolase [Candidatus Sulfomarinibacteraceae bacterium]
MTETTSYRAVALQTTCRAVTPCRTVDEARARIAENIERVGRQIPSTIAWTGPDTRLIVLPEYLFTGFPTRETADEWIAKACFTDGCAELESLGAVAQASSIHLAGNAYEFDAHFPGIFFQTSFVVDPSGDVVLRYRRLNSMYSPTPHDVWDAYVDRYGLDGVFPVATTEIGRLAAVASEEILYPEVSRCLAMRGAEVLVHSTCEVGSPRETPKGIAKRARAIENLAYVVSANTAGMEGLDLPSASADGGSCVVDFKGKILAEAGYGESCVAYADIDLAALRRFRRRPGMENLLSRQRFEAYAASYAQHTHYPANTMADGFDGRAHFVRTQAEVIERLAKKGVI